MIWVVFALFTGAAVFAVLWPLSRAPLTSDARELDVAFYRAQTAEIERDAARGVIGAQEAEIARTEAGRRLVAASTREAVDVRGRSPAATRVVALGAVVFIPAIALVLYAYVGAANLPDAPLEARLSADPSKMDMAAMIARIERNVAKNPNDGRGWALLARIYTRLGRAGDAAAAYRNEIRVLGASEERLSEFGEVETAANGGRVTTDARQAFEQALSMSSQSPQAQFYLGLAAEQGGDKAKAVALWSKLIADSPPDAPWLPAVRSHLAAAGDTPGPDAGTPSGPDRMAAAVAALPPDEQQTMIHRMVDGLADRLKLNGDDIDGWLRLVRAYRVLDERDKAKVALGEARRNFVADPAATKRLADLARELGLES